MVKGVKPSGSQVTRGVMGKLDVFAGLPASSLPGSLNVTFTPSLVIVAGRIEKLGVDIRSFHEPLLRSIREVMTVSIRRNFDVGGRPAWEPLSEGTLEVRRHWGNSNSDPLIWTGRLRRVASQINIWTITRKSALIISLPQKVWYGAIHQAGYGGGGGGQRSKSLSRSEKKALRIMRTSPTPGYPVSPIPARPFVVLQPKDEDAITEIFIKWLDERVQRAWPGVHT